MTEYLRATSIDKTYDGTVKALDDVSLSVAKGRVHAIIGENGAGKSTFAKVLAGLVPFDSGSIEFKGKPYRPNSPRDAAAVGIGMVHQHFMLFPSLTVAENIVLGTEPGSAVRMDAARTIDEARALSEHYGMPLDPRRRLGDLSVGEQQRVEILKALRRDIELLILDEPTAVLTPQEVTKLFKGIRRLMTEDYTVIVIAHKLEEVLEIADEVTVLRKGRAVASRRRADTSKAELVRLMVGEDLATGEPHDYGDPGLPVLAISGLGLEGPDGKKLLDDVDLEVRAGEIVGVAGVEGNGQFELEQVLGGLAKATSGAVTLDSRDITTCSARLRRDLGLAYIPGDRMVWGCAPGASVFDNAISRYYRQHSTGGIMRKRELRESVHETFKRFDVRSPAPWMPISSLSGGNIQKLILSRELGGERPKALVVAMPTRGIDIRGVESIHALLRRYRDDGCAVLLISTDLDEVIALSDRIAVLYDGSIAAVMNGKGESSKEQLGAYMLHGTAA